MTVTEYVKVELLIGLNIITNHLLKPVSYPLLGHFYHNFKILFFVGDRGGTFLISTVSDSYQHQHDLTRIYQHAQLFSLTCISQVLRSAAGLCELFYTRMKSTHPLHCPLIYSFFWARYEKQTYQSTASKETSQKW